jgi:hypothetical protein
MRGLHDFKATSSARNASKFVQQMGLAPVKLTANAPLFPDEAAASSVCATTAPEDSSIALGEDANDHVRLAGVGCSKRYTIAALFDANEQMGQAD